jgi:hypothetical protein
MHLEMPKRPIIWNTKPNIAIFIWKSNTYRIIKTSGSRIRKFQLAQLTMSVLPLNQYHCYQFNSY